MEFLCSLTGMATPPLLPPLSPNARRTRLPFPTAAAPPVSGLRRRTFRGGAVAGPIRAVASSGVTSKDRGGGAAADLRRSEPSADSSGGADEFERELQGLFDEVKDMIAGGKHEDAVSLLQANFEAVKGEIDAGSRSIEEAAVLDVVALGYMRIGDFKMVETILELMNEVVGDIYDDGRLLGSVLMHMGSMYSSLGKFEKSTVMYRRSISILEQLYGESSTFLVTPLLGMAKALGSIQRTAKATEIYCRAISILELSRGPESEDLVVPLSGLGNLLITEGKVDDAESPFLRIVSIYKTLYGDKDGRVGMALSSLAHVKCAKGDVNEAINLYKSALQIIKDSNSMALDDSMMEKMRIDLAELLHVTGRGNEGRQLLEECLLISEKYKGKDHPDYVRHLLNLATSYSRSKNFVEAERLLRTGLDVMTRTLRPDDPSISFPTLHLAVTLYHLKRDEEAEDLAKDALLIREKAFGEDSLPVGEALDCLISIQTRMGKDDDQLVALLQRVLKIQEKEIGYESEEVTVTLKKIVFYLEKLGRRDEKVKLQKRLSVLKMKYKQMMHY